MCEQGWSGGGSVFPEKSSRNSGTGRGRESWQKAGWLMGGLLVGQLHPLSSYSCPMWRTKIELGRRRFPCGLWPRRIKPSSLWHWNMWWAAVPSCPPLHAGYAEATFVVNTNGQPCQSGKEPRTRSKTPWQLHRHILNQSSSLFTNKNWQPKGHQTFESNI